MATRDDKIMDEDRTDKEWHANLLCKLSGMLLDKDLKNLKQVIRTSEKVPPKDVEKCDDFFILWETLERLGQISVGNYSTLIKHLEMLKLQDCVLAIRGHTTKIEEYRQGQPEELVKKVERLEIEIEGKNLKMADMEKQLQESKDSYDELRTVNLELNKDLQITREQMQRQHLEVTETRKEKAKCQEQYACEVDQANSLAQSKETDAIRLAEELDAGRARESRTSAENRCLKHEIDVLKGHTKEVLSKSTGIGDFTLTIHGGQYVAYQVPPADSDLVGRELNNILQYFSIQTMVIKVDVVADCLRLANYAAACDADLGIQIANMQVRVAKIVQETNETVIRIRMKAGEIIDDLYCAFTYFLDGFEERGLHCFKDSREKSNQLKSKFTEISTGLDLEMESIYEVLNGFQQKEKKRRDDVKKYWRKFKADAKQSEKESVVIDAANYALKTLCLNLNTVTRFWLTMNEQVANIDNTGDKKILSLLEKIKNPEERNAYWRSTTLAKQVVKFFAKWVALRLQCEDYTIRIQGVELSMKHRLAEVPSEAEQKIPGIVAGLKTKLKEEKDYLDKIALEDEREYQALLE